MTEVSQTQLMMAVDKLITENSEIKLKIQQLQKHQLSKVEFEELKKEICMQLDTGYLDKAETIEQQEKQAYAERLAKLCKIDPANIDLDKINLEYQEEEKLTQAELDYIITGKNQPNKNDVVVEQVESKEELMKLGEAFYKQSKLSREEMSKLSGISIENFGDEKNESDS